MLISLTEALQTSFSSSWGPTSHQSHKKFPHHIPQMVGNIKIFPHHIPQMVGEYKKFSPPYYQPLLLLFAMWYSQMIFRKNNFVFFPSNHHVPKSNFDCFPPIKLPQIFSYFAALFSCCWCLITCYCYFCYKVIVYENKVTCIFLNLSTSHIYYYGSILVYSMVPNNSAARLLIFEIFSLPTLPIWTYTLIKIQIIFLPTCLLSIILNFILSNFNTFYSLFSLQLLQ